MAKAIKAKSFSDIVKKGEVDIIEVNYRGAVYEFDVVKMTHGRWQEIGNQPEYPEAPTKRAGKRSVEKDFNDPRYRAKLLERQQLVSLLRVVEAVQLDYPSPDHMERVKWLNDEWPPGIVSALMAGVFDLHMEGDPVFNVEERGMNF